MVEVVRLGIGDGGVAAERGDGVLDGAVDVHELQARQHQALHRRRGLGPERLPAQERTSALAEPDDDLARDVRAIRSLRP